LALIDLKTQPQHSNEEKKKKDQKKDPYPPRKFFYAIKYALLHTAMGIV
jgi:hypothetical protein